MVCSQSIGRGLFSYAHWIEISLTNNSLGTFFMAAKIFLSLIPFSFNSSRRSLLFLIKEISENNFKKEELFNVKFVPLLNNNAQN